MFEQYIIILSNVVRIKKKKKKKKISMKNFRIFRVAMQPHAKMSLHVVSSRRRNSRLVKRDESHVCTSTGPECKQARSF